MCCPSTAAKTRWRNKLPEPPPVVWLLSICVTTQKLILDINLDVDPQFVLLYETLSHITEVADPVESRP